MTNAELARLLRQLAEELGSEKHKGSTVRMDMTISKPVTIVHPPPYFNVSYDEQVSTLVVETVPS